VRFLRLFEHFLTKSEWKLAEIGGFWVLFEHPHFQAKKGVEKSREKIRKMKKIFTAENAKTAEIKMKRN
jgi:hypothetical protein